jgi:hypothetical protein
MLWGKAEKQARNSIKEITILKAAPFSQGSGNPDKYSAPAKSLMITQARSKTQECFGIIQFVK